NERGNDERADEARYPEPDLPDGFRLPDAREGREEHLLDRGGEPHEWYEHRVVGDCVDAERMCAGEAPDDEVVRVAFAVEEQVAAEDVTAVAGEASEARAREG